MSLLSLRNIETFYGPVMAVRGISFDIEEGKIAAILGANGAGKSTILRTISGIIAPQKGEITFDGRSCAGADPSRIVRAGIAHVPEGREVFPFLSIADNLAMGAYIHAGRGQKTKDDLARVYDYFPILRERRKQPAGQLSGGEQQMLAMARALMCRPKLLLLDEPSLGLSPRLVQDIFQIISRINQNEGVTILLVEQNARMALKIAEYGYVLENGRIVLDDRCEVLMDNEDIKEFYLGLTGHQQRAEKRWKRRKSWG